MLRQTVRLGRHISCYSIFLQIICSLSKFRFAVEMYRVPDRI